MLEKILKELQYQTKLMESIYEKKDEHQVGAVMVKKQMESFKKIILSTPGINPEIINLIMPGGDK